MDIRLQEIVETMAMNRALGELKMVMVEEELSDDFWRTACDLIEKTKDRLEVSQRRKYED